MSTPADRHPVEPLWQQVFIHFHDYATADAVAASNVDTEMTSAEADGTITGWFFMRKNPCWRLRFQPAPTVQDAVAAIHQRLDTLRAASHIADWVRVIYEPETVAFGGQAGMDVAHALFHADSRHLLARIGASANRASALGQRETTVLLFSAMLRAAELDWFEQGDVWASVAGLRPDTLARLETGRRAEKLGQAVRHLMTVDPRGVADALAEPWLAAFETAGQNLAVLNRSGKLERGLRAVLAHHFIFHANRAGIRAADQATLVDLATRTVFHTAPSQSNTVPTTMPTSPTAATVDVQE
jgi:protein-L-isoaspartate(D-aspartate) O-methyltransferase